MDNINVLITCAGRRHYLVEYFREVLQGRGSVIGADMDTTAPALTLCDVAHQVPSVFAPEYLHALVEVMRKENVNLVFSVNDFELGLLADKRGDLELETSARLVVSSSDTSRVGADKWLLHERCLEMGINTPATFLQTDHALAKVAAGNLAFPLMVKPRWGSGSLGLFVVQSPDELEKRFNECGQLVMNSGVGKLGGEDHARVIIQEMIQGNEYGVDILYGLDGGLRGFAAKKKLAMRAGETDRAITVDSGPFQRVVEQITGGFSHRGNMDCDFLERSGELFLLEINPRFGGGYPFTHLAGANHVKMIIDEYAGLDPGAYSYDVGRLFAKCDRLVEIKAS